MVPADVKVASPSGRVAAPVDERSRITALDVLRGVALLGILVMNIQSFAMPDAAYTNPTAYGDLTGMNRWVWIVGHLLADQKMFGLFSLLFGAGILLMTSRVEERGGKSAALHVRRMAWLIVFGLLHAHLLWHGDILYTYGICGLFAFLFRRRSVSMLLVCAGLFFLIGSSLSIAAGLRMSVLPHEQVVAFERSDWRPPPETVEQEIDAYRGGWLEQMPRRHEGAVEMEVFDFLFLYAWKTLGNMLLGMALFRAGVITAQRSRVFYGWLAAGGFAVGLPIVALGIVRNMAAGWDVRYSYFFGTQYNYWGSILVDLGWIGAIMLLCLAPAFERLTQALGAVGRTAFSNYILQTLIATTLFYGHGFGLFGSIDRVGQAAIVAAIWAVQLAIAPLWLCRFRYGPLEWLWRSLTYGTMMSFRRA